MPQVRLDRAGILPVIGERIPAGVAQHVGVDGKIKPGPDPSLQHNAKELLAG